MPSDFWFDYLENELRGTGVLDYYPPVAFRRDISFLPFGPYSLEGGIWEFRTALRFESPAPFPLLAMTTGSIFFQPATGSDPARVTLLRGDTIGEALRRQIGILPHSFHEPPYVVYENVDPKSVESAVKILLGASTITDPLVARVRNSDLAFQAAPDVAAQLTTRWLMQGIPGGIFVQGGAVLGVGAVSTTGKFAVQVRMLDEVDPPSAISYNPSHHLAAWQELKWLKSTPLFDGLADMTTPPSGNGTIKPVNAGMLISEAISNAMPGDTILITDTAVYKDAVVIDKNVNLMGVGVKAADDPFPDYPKLTGENTRRPLTFQNVNSGIAYAGRLIIENGWATGDRQDGGGVLIERSNNVAIASCVVRKCAASGDGFFGEGFGGGIAIYHSSPAVLHCIVTDNEANSRGKGIGLYGFGWPTIVGCHIADNDPHAFGSNPRPDGGGIAIQIGVTTAETRLDLLLDLNDQPLSKAFDANKLLQMFETYVRIVDTLVENNVSDDDGGGIYITCASRALLRNVRLLHNKAAGNGGGLRATFAAQVILRDCILDGNESNYRLRRLGETGSDGDTIPGVMGGGLAARNADLIDLTRTQILNNTSNGWAGGGLSFISVDEGAPSTFLKALAIELLASLVGLTVDLNFDWNNFLWDPNIYDHTSATLRIDSESRIEGNQATLLPTLITSSLRTGAAVGAMSLTLTQIAGLAGVEIVINEGEANEERVKITQVTSSTAPWIATIDPRLKLAHMAGEPVGRTVTNHGKGGGLYILRWAGDRASGFDVPAEHQNSQGKMEAWPVDVLILDSAAVLPSQNHASFPGADRMFYDNLVSNPERTFADQDLAEREAIPIKVYVNEF